METSSVVLVREWYEQSFAEIRRSPPPIDIESESAFARLLQAPPSRGRPAAPRATRVVRCARRPTTACTQGIYERHAPTLVTMAKGVHELRNELETSRGDGCDGPPLTRARAGPRRRRAPGPLGDQSRRYPGSYHFSDASDVHAFLDKFYMSRIGIRILIGQYLELRREEGELPMGCARPPGNEAETIAEWMAASC